MKVIEAPLSRHIYLQNHITGDTFLGLHIATVASDSGLEEYVVAYDNVDDKVLAFYKRYMNPEDPADFQTDGIYDQHLLNEIAYFCNKEGLFDGLPRKTTDEEDSDKE